MKAETLISMMEQEEYQALTCAEFAEIVRDSKVLEVEVGANDLDFLKAEWMPKDTNIETIPGYMNAAIAEQSEKERR